MGNVRLILARKMGQAETLGTYIVMDDNVELYRCCCIELPWLNNQNNISCIPGGIYDAEKFNSVEHPNTILIKNVMGRTGILIHKGNFATGKQVDTQGCQIPGLSFVDIDGNGTLDVAGSDIAMRALNYFLPDKFKIIIV
jgi:hypothetical protein